MSNIIQLSTVKSRRTAEIEASAISATVHRMPIGPTLGRRGRPHPEPLTDTCRNQRLRLKRREAWWAAGRLTSYWTRDAKEVCGPSRAIWKPRPPPRGLSS
jgi:hypothetical protein